MVVCACGGSVHVHVHEHEQGGRVDLARIRFQ